MVAVAMAASLPPARRRLLTLMQELNFGWIENLPIRKGQPVFNPAPVFVRQVKFGGDNLPRIESRLADFSLRKPVEELLEHLDRIDHGMIQRLEVKHGLPFMMFVAEDAN